MCSDFLQNTTNSNEKYQKLISSKTRCNIRSLHTLTHTHSSELLIYYCVFVSQSQHKQSYVLEHVDKAAMAHCWLMDGRVCHANY